VTFNAHTDRVIAAARDGIDLLRPDLLDRMIVWRMQDPRYNKRLDAVETRMQRQFTIELRVDYEDAEKNPVMKEALLRAARHVFATATLLADAVKPQIVLFSDDFMVGHEEIPLLEDTLGKAIEEAGGQEQEGVSEEMLKAVRDMHNGE
jgi:hypothetical protein